MVGVWASCNQNVWHKLRGVQVQVVDSRVWSRMVNGKQVIWAGTEGSHIAIGSGDPFSIIGDRCGELHSGYLWPIHMLDKNIVHDTCYLLAEKHYTLYMLFVGWKTLYIIHVTCWWNTLYIVHVMCWLEKYTLYMLCVGWKTLYITNAMWWLKNIIHYTWYVWVQKISHCTYYVLVKIVI